LSLIQVYRLFRAYAEVAGLPESKSGHHSLKHTLAQHMINKRPDIARVQVVLGHASVSRTMAYFQVGARQADPDLRC